MGGSERFVRIKKGPNGRATKEEERKKEEEGNDVRKRKKVRKNTEVFALTIEYRYSHSNLTEGRDLRKL